MSDRLRSELLPDVPPFSLARLDAWIETFVKNLAVQETGGGSRKKQYGDLFGKIFYVTTSLLVGTARGFVDYWKYQDLCTPPCSGDLKERKKGVLIM